MKKGFTLIELLVVVLIIGILSAMALPQYTKAVEKSRSAEAQMMIRDLTLAIDRYVLANGFEAKSAAELEAALDIEPASSQTFAWKGTNTKCTATQCDVEVTQTKGNHFKLKATKTSSATSWTKTCSAKSGDDVGSAICSSLSSNGYGPGTAY